MTNKTYKLVSRYYSWEQVTATTLNYSAHTDILVGLDMVLSLPTYFKKIFADKDGQKSNYGFSLPDKRGIHVKVYEDHYKVHWDKRSSLTDPLGHLYHDAPHWIVILIIGLSAVVIGAVAVKKWKG